MSNCVSLKISWAVDSQENR